MAVLMDLRKALSGMRVSEILKRAWSDGYAMSLLDGNMFETKRRALGSKLIGVDQSGNKYWENMNAQQGRHRWVEYKETWNYNASTVPPEWHGWLHHITDDLPDKILKLQPSYAIPHKANLTGEGDDKIYHAKGHALNPSQRDWSKVETWLPAK